MTRPEAETITTLSKRPDRTIAFIAIAFALGGAVADLVSHGLTGAAGSGGIGLLWGLWIPLCFLTIPPLHYLSRQVVDLRERLDALEGKSQSSARNAV